MKKTMLSTSILLATVGLSGCGPQDEAYDTVVKDPNEVSTSLIEQKNENGEARRYLFMRSIQNAPRYASSFMAHYLNEAKVVTLTKSEHGIEVKEIEHGIRGIGDNSSRYSSQYNSAPVMTINGSYTDYRCKTDSQDRCVNVEEVNGDADVQWDQKKYFTPDFTNIDVKDLDITDLVFKQCIQAIGAPRLARRTESGEGNNQYQWKGHDVDLNNGVINIELAQDYTMRSSCPYSFDWVNVNNNSFTITEMYSIVALNAKVQGLNGEEHTLTDPDYKPVAYSENDSLTFGLFTTSPGDGRTALGASGVDDYTRTYLTRFSPNKNSIPFYLSNNFYKPENKAFLDATFQSIDILNIQNEMYNTGLPKIVLSPAEEKQPGDVRYQFIVLEDQPLDNGLLGYAPKIANPLTGEIVGGIVNQYSANIVSLMHRSYYESLRKKFNDGVLYNQSSLLTNLAIETSNRKDALSDENKHEFKKQLNFTDNLILVDNHANNIVDKDLDILANESAELLEKYSENNMLVSDAISVPTAAAQTLPLGVKGHYINWNNPELYEKDSDGNLSKRLKAFDNLSPSLQQEMALKLGAASFQSTLLHEIGHGIGLRHNFSGNLDKDNFFNSYEIHELRSAFDKAGYPKQSTYSGSSSVMEYDANPYASIYGKYDLAALRFAYSREVLADDGKTPVSLKSFDSEKRAELSNYENGGDRTGRIAHLGGVLKAAEKSLESTGGALHSYRFCTDGNVSLNSDCNRFDEGHDVADIWSNYIKRYKDNFVLSHSRGIKETMNEYTEIDHIIRQVNFFRTLNEIMEDTGRWVSLGTEYSDLGYNSFDGYREFCQNLLPDSGLDFLCPASSAMTSLSDFYLEMINKPEPVVYYQNIKDNSLEEVVSLDILLSNAKRNPLIEPGETFLTGGENLDKLKIANFGFSDPDADLNRVVIYGASLNSHRATVSDPDHPYTNDLDVYGIWPEKLIAMRSLFTRDTGRFSTTRTDAALVDDSNIAEQFKLSVCSWAMNQKPNTLIQLENNAQDLMKESVSGTALEVCTRFAGIDSNRSAVILPTFDNIVDLDIAPISIAAPFIARYFGLSTNEHGQAQGSTPLFKALLTQVVMASQSETYNSKELARSWREFVGWHQGDKNIEAKAVIFNNQTYYISEVENSLANLLWDYHESLLAENQVKPIQDIQMEFERVNKLLSMLPVLDKKGQLIL